MMEPGSAAQIIKTYLDHLLQASGFALEYTLEIQSPMHELEIQASSGIPDHSASAPVKPALSIHFTGSDVPLLTTRDAELLHAIEIVAASILRLDRTEHHRLIFDAGNLRAERARSLERAASDAVAQVRSTGTPFSFAPMNSRERRLLHLALASSGLQTASAGEGPSRSVVLYPPGQTPPPSLPYASRLRREAPPHRLVAATSGRPASPPHDRSVPLDRTRMISSRDPDMQPRSVSDSVEGSFEQSQDERVRAIRERFRKR